MDASFLRCRRALAAATVCALVAALHSPPAFAQSGCRARIEARLKAADADGDGLLSRAEAQRTFPKQAQRFDEIDTNRDGYLSHDELAAAFRAKHQPSGGAAGTSS
jgi:EF hand